MITIHINGTPVRVNATAPLTEALIHAGIDPERKGIAVAVDEAVVPRRLWPRTLLNDGARVEVVTATQGG